MAQMNIKFGEDYTLQIRSPLHWEIILVYKKKQGVKMMCSDIG